MSGRVRVLGESRKRVRGKLLALENGLHDFYEEYASNMRMISKGFGDIIVENAALRNLLCRNALAKLFKPLTRKRLSREMKKVRKNFEDQANKELREAQMKKELDEKLEDGIPLPERRTDVRIKKEEKKQEKEVDEPTDALLSAEQLP